MDACRWRTMKEKAGKMAYRFTQDVEKQYPGTFQLDPSTRDLVVVRSLNSEEMEKYFVILCNTL